MNEKLIKLYSEKFLPKELDIFGLKFYHQIDDDLGISWSMRNPNDLSYNVEVLKGHIEDRVTSFAKISGIENHITKSFREKLSRFEHSPKFYLNKKDEEEIKNQSDSIKMIDFKNFKIPVRIKKITFEPGYDWIRMGVHFQIDEMFLKIKGTIPWLKKLDKEEINKIVNDNLYINDEFQQEYMYHLMSPELSIIENIPTIFNDDYTFIEIHYGFYYINGEHV